MARCFVERSGDWLGIVKTRSSGGGIRDINDGRFRLSTIAPDRLGLFARWILWLGVAFRTGRNTPGKLPKLERNGHRINVELGPPCTFVALSVKLTMMDPAQRDRELVRNPPAECPRLGIANVVSLAGLPAVNRARLNGNEPQMIFVARAAQLQEANRSVVAILFAPRPSLGLTRRWSRSRGDLRRDLLGSEHWGSRCDRDASFGR